MTTTTTPHNREAEEALLGAVLINPEAYFDAAGFLRPEDFYIHRHRWVWEAVSSLQASSQPVDLLTLCNELERMGKLAEVGGVSYLAGLLNSTPSSLHAEAYGRIVEESAVRRRMLQAASNVARLASQGQAEVDALLEDAERSLHEVSEQRQRWSARSLGEVLKSLYEHTTVRATGKAVSGIPTGFTELDKLLGGMQNSDVLIVAGRPGMGKTAFLLSVTRQAAQMHGKKIAFFSLEMDAEPIGLRLAAQESGIDSACLRDGRLTAEEWTTYARAIEKLSELPILLDETPAITPLQLLTRCRRIQREQGLDLVVLDYLQLMSAGQRVENRNQEISYVSRQLKVLARELNIPVLAAAQLSRAVEQRADRRPMLSDLRESGSIEQDADAVIFLHRPDNSAVEMVEVSLAKHRNGPTGDLRLRYQSPLTRFENPT